MLGKTGNCGLLSSWAITDACSVKVTGRSRTLEIVPLKGMRLFGTLVSGSVHGVDMAPCSDTFLSSSPSTTHAGTHEYPVEHCPHRLSQWRLWGRRVIRSQTQPTAVPLHLLPSGSTPSLARTRGYLLCCCSVTAPPILYIMCHLRGVIDLVIEGEIGG